MTARPISPAAAVVDNKAMPLFTHTGSKGFSLVESLMAVLILAFGFMLTGPLLVNSVKSTTLAGSQSTAGLAAAQMLEDLAIQYRANPDSFTIGTHDPVQVEIVNPNDNSKLNRFNVGYTVSAVPDPRTGKVLRAVQVTVTVTPIGSGTSANNQLGQNKVVNVTTILSFRV